MDLEEIPKGYSLQWVEGRHPDETDTTVETVGDE